MNTILLYVKRVHEEMKRSVIFRNLVLFITAFNYIGVAILPVLFFVIAGTNELDQSIYIDLGWAALLTATLLYCGQHLGKTGERYFGNKVPAFLIAVYFVTIVFVFLVKTAVLVSAPLLASFTFFEMAFMDEFYIWSILGLVLYMWQLNMLYTVCQQELN